MFFCFFWWFFFYSFYFLVRCPHHRLEPFVYLSSLPSQSVRLLFLSEDKQGSTSRETKLVLSLCLFSESRLFHPFLLRFSTRYYHFIHPPPSPSPPPPLSARRRLNTPPLTQLFSGPGRLQLLAANLTAPSSSCSSCSSRSLQKLENSFKYPFDALLPSSIALQKPPPPPPFSSAVVVTAADTQGTLGFCVNRLQKSATYLPLLMQTIEQAKF